MNSFYQNSKYLIYQSLLLAILLHVFIFTLFTFTFSISTLNKKPNLIFLGSLLQNKYFINNEIKENVESFNYHNEIFTNLMHKKQLEIFKFKNKKPVLNRRTISPIDKINNKTLFFSNDEDIKKLDKFKSNMNNSHYIPLKYNTL